MYTQIQTQKMPRRMTTRGGARSTASFVLVFMTFIVSGCNNAAPPRLVPPSTDGGTGRAAAATGPTRDSVNERAIAGVWNEAIARPDGSTFKLSDFKGKIVVVDFWATWCPPCREQAPQLAKLSQKYRGKGLEVVGLSLNEKKDQAEVLEFVKSAGMNYRIGYAGDRISAGFLTGTEDETGMPPIPQLFIFGRDGRLVEYLVGYNESHGLPFLERVVTEQLAR